MYAPGSTIDSWTYCSALLPFSRLPAALASWLRLGPMFPVEPALLSWWQPPQPAAVKICSPVVAPARPACASAPLSSPGLPVAKAT